MFPQHKANCLIQILIGYYTVRSGKGVNHFSIVIISTSEIHWHCFTFDHRTLKDFNCPFFKLCLVMIIWESMKKLWLQNRWIRHSQESICSIPIVHAHPFAIPCRNIWSCACGCNVMPTTKLPDAKSTTCIRYNSFPAVMASSNTLIQAKQHLFILI